MSNKDGNFSPNKSSGSSVSSCSNLDRGLINTALKNSSSSLDKEVQHDLDRVLIINNSWKKRSSRPYKEVSLEYIH